MQHYGVLKKPTVIIDDSVFTYYAHAQYLGTMEGKQAVITVFTSGEFPTSPTQRNAA